MVVLYIYQSNALARVYTFINKKEMGAKMNQDADLA